MKHLQRIILILTLILLPAAAMADGKGERKGPKPDKNEWMRKMKEFKHDFMTRELDLGPKQRDEFFRLYDAKETERFEAERKVRKMEKELLKKGTEAKDADYDKVIEAQNELNDELADIDQKYTRAFRKILTRRQIFLLPHAERKFQRQLMEGRHDAPKPPKP